MSRCVKHWNTNILNAAELWTIYILLVKNWLPSFARSGSVRFRAQIHLPKALPDLFYTASFGYFFCPDLDQSIFEPRYAFPKQWRILSILFHSDPFSMGWSRSGRKGQPDNGKVIKFMISLGSLAEARFWLALAGSRCIWFATIL